MKKQLLSLSTILFCMLLYTNLNAQIITTIAGTGTAGYSGDGGAATAAELNLPYKVAVDATGNVYFTDYFNHCVRKINTSGIISTIAGTGTSGYNGNGGPATSAQLIYPEGVTLDAAGNIYISEDGAGYIRKINTSGIISIIAGSIGGSPADGIPATSAVLNRPSGVAVDAIGNVYIAEYSNNRIRKVDTNGIIHTFAGNGASSFGGDGGPATLASLHSPSEVVVDAIGNVYIADVNNQRIRKVDTSGIIHTIAGNGTQGYNGDGGLATMAQLYSPHTIAVDPTGNVYITDVANHRIRKVDTFGIISTIAGTGAYGFSGDGGLATLAELNAPYGVAIDAAGNIFIADKSNNRIRKITACTTFPTVIASSDVSICLGQSTDISASGVPTFTWDNGLGTGSTKTVSPTSETTYTVIGMDGNGCQNTDQVTVTVKPLPTVNASADTSICVGQSTDISASGASTFTWDNGLGTGNTKTVSPTSNETYTVTGIGGNGCQNTDEVTVTVNPLPTVIAGNYTAICLGQSTVISAAGASTFSWDNGLGTGNLKTVFPTTYTTYTVTGTDGKGCTNTAQVSILVTQPNTGVTQNGATLTSDANGATYIWLDCNNSYSVIPDETNQTFVASVNGSYALEVIQNGCPDTSACYIITTVGIKENTQSSYKLYPNPVSNELTIESQGVINQIEVYSLAGQLLQTTNPQSKEIKINFSTYVRGVYLVKVQTADGRVATSRVVKD